MAQVHQAAPDTARVMVDFTQMKSFGQDPLILERGEGIRVTDVFGQTYIDGLSGVFTVNLGHGVQELIDVAAEQARKIAFTAPTMATNPPALRLADLLIGITPEQYTTVKFFTGGSEANEAAIKLARQYWLQAGHPRKYKVISRYRSYHGGTGHAMAASAQTAWKWKFEPFAPGFVHVTPPARPGCAACRRADACTMACLDLMEQAIVEEHPETVAAVIAEPVMLSAGVHRAASGVLPAPARALRPPQRAADLRRDHHRLRAHRPPLRRRAGGRLARHPDLWQGDQRRLRPALRDPHRRPGVARPSGGSRKRECSSGRDTPSAATRSPAPSARRRCATCSTTI